MNTEIAILSLTALSVGFFHTLFGPDHYLPFIVMGKARNWSVSWTILITVICGIGHVLSSVLLGLLGVAMGIGLMKLEAFESFRGNLAAWSLIGFGFAYFVWGLHRAFKNAPHDHFHAHEKSGPHDHKHSHNGEHVHVHEKEKKSITPWVLFVIFVLGPCEPLIPILMYPAARNSCSGLLIVTGVFAAATITTMTSIVVLSVWGISFARLGKLERYVHAFAGAAICLSGLAIQFLGL